MATKENRIQVRGLIEGLESRVHRGPPIHDAEILSVREFLRQNDFSPASEYHLRLMQIKSRLEARGNEVALPSGKRNYGGEAGGYWMQVQSAFDHLILSTCYEGEFNMNHGRIKISHRFNQEGRIDFVELKFLRSLQSCLNGEIRKLLLVKGYPSLPRDWRAAEAFVLEILPRELVFLYKDIFRCPRNEVLAWLINVGHGLVEDLLKALRVPSTQSRNAHTGEPAGQLCLEAVHTDQVALPILNKASLLKSAVQSNDDRTVFVRYLTK